MRADEPYPDAVYFQLFARVVNDPRFRLFGLSHADILTVRRRMDEHHAITVEGALKDEKNDIGY
jgi:hypothetical protein